MLLGILTTAAQVETLAVDLISAASVDCLFQTKPLHRIRSKIATWREAFRSLRKNSKRRPTVDAPRSLVLQQGSRRGISADGRKSQYIRGTGSPSYSANGLVGYYEYIRSHYEPTLFKHSSSWGRPRLKKYSRMVVLGILASKDSTVPTRMESLTAHRASGEAASLKIAHFTHSSRECPVFL